MYNYIELGKDCFGCAKTGSGKTAAFALPMLQKLAEDPYGIFGVVITPTRSSKREDGASGKVPGYHEYMNGYSPPSCTHTHTLCNCWTFSFHFVHL